MYQYKNKTDADQVIIGLGIIKAGEQFQSNKAIECPALELVSGSENQQQTNEGEQQ